MATIGDDSIRAFMDMKLGKGARPAFVLFRYNDAGVLVPHHSSAHDATYDEFVQALRPNAACYGVVGINYALESGAKRSKMLFIVWIPSGCSRAEKMTYCMFASIARRSFSGIHCNIQANDYDDLAWSEVLNRASRFENAE